MVKYLLTTMLLLSVSLYASDRFTVGTGIVTDNVTGLVWQQPASTSTYTWGLVGTAGTAQNYCNGITTGGVSAGTWRMPTVKELSTLLTIGFSNSIHMDSVFAGEAVDLPYWASTASVGDNNFAWAVNFSNGSVGTIFINLFGPTLVYVRCVH